MKCERCGFSVVLLAHDAAALDHQWPPGHEEQCPCVIDAVCAFCEADRVRRDGFVLLERSGLGLGVASRPGLIH